MEIKVPKPEGISITRWSVIHRMITGALEAVDPYKVVQNDLKVTDKSIVIGEDIIVDRSSFTRIHLLGIGKASIPMVSAAAEGVGARRSATKSDMVKSIS